jgi:Leucine-rich repeat (LRR) protein
MKPQVNAVEKSPLPALESRSPILCVTVRGLILLVAGLAGWLGWIVHNARAQHDAVVAITKAGGFVEYRRTDLSALGSGGKQIRKTLDWMLPFVGRDYIDHPVGVSWGGWNCEHILSDEQRLALTPALARIGMLTRLAYLDLSWTNGQNCDFIGIKRLKQLKELNLSFTTVIDPRPIGAMDRLEKLSLFATPANDAWLFHFKSLTRLRLLRLGETGITDIGLAHLRGLTQLQELDLMDTRVTDAGLIHLQALVNLARLHLYGTNVTDAGIQRLRRALPHCDVQD